MGLEKVKQLQWDTQRRRDTVGSSDKFLSRHHNMLETNEKIQSLIEETEDEKNRMELVELKNAITEI